MGIATVSDRRLTGESSAGKPRDDIPRPAPVWFIRYRAQKEGEIADLQRQLAEIRKGLLESERAERHMDEIQQTALVSYENVQRAVALAPKYVDLTPQEHRYVADVAWSLGIHPEFHLHAWHERKKTKEGWVDVLRMMVDYSALILKAKSDRRVMVKERRLTADEMRARSIPESDIAEGSIAYVCELYDLQDWAYMSDHNLAEHYEPMRGYGWWAAMKDETRWDKRENKTLPTGKRIPNDVPNGRDGAWVAWKRATRALYVQLADLTPHPRLTAEILSQDVLEYDPAAPPAIEEGEYSEVHWTDDSEQVEAAREWFTGLGLTDEDVEAGLECQPWTDTTLKRNAFRAKVEELLLPVSNQGRVLICEECGEPGADDTPVGILCNPCAHRKADELASKQ